MAEVRIEMEMPDCCCNCRFAVMNFAPIGYCCAIEGEEIFWDSLYFETKRLDNCPLKECNYGKGKNLDRLSVTLTRNDKKKTLEVSAK